MSAYGCILKYFVRERVWK